jgi:hypothetical protein
VTRRFEDFEPDQYELVYSFMSPFFLGRQAFGEVCGRLVRSLAPGGVLAIATLGERDEWSWCQPDDGGDGWVPDDGGTFLGREEWTSWLGASRSSAFAMRSSSCACGTRAFAASTSWSWSHAGHRQAE